MSTQATDRANGGPEPKNGDRPARKKFGLVLQRAAALGAYEAGAIEYLYESGMECAIVSRASSGAMNAATLAGAKGYPPQVLRELWGMLAVNPPIPFLPPVIRQSWSMFGVPHMYTPRLDFWNMPSWTYVSDNMPFRKTLGYLLDWDQIRDPEHMLLIVSASGVEDGGTEYFGNLDPSVPLGPEHMLASGSFPGGFDWTRIGDRDYWDGGLTDNTPLKPVIDNLQGNEPETMPIIMIDVFSSSAPQPANMNEVVLRMFELFLQNKLKADSDTAQSYTRFIRRRAPGPVRGGLPPGCNSRSRNGRQLGSKFPSGCAKGKMSTRSTCSGSSQRFRPGHRCGSCGLSQTRRARPGPSCNKQDGTASLEGCGCGAAARCGERHYRLEC